MSQNQSNISLQRHFHGDFMVWLDVMQLVQACGRAVQGGLTPREEAWEEVVEGKHDISSFRACTKQERIPVLKVPFASLSNLWGNAVDGPPYGLCKQHRANLFLSAMTFLGTLRGTQPLAGVWLEGFSFGWCGGPTLFQLCLSREELLAEDKQFREDLLG